LRYESLPFASTALRRGQDNTGRKQAKAAQNEVGEGHSSCSVANTPDQPGISARMSDAGREALVYRCRSGRRIPYEVPNHLLGHTVAPALPATAHLSEELSCLNARRNRPVVQSSVDPIWYRDGSNVAALPHQVGDCPVLFAFLQVIDRQFGDLVPSEATRQQNC
jgi:hypothetical protein